eukprot:CAMPEP_0184010778 /NCGR_PEP_ID=MMETSP0954-20121128/3424_1 /TAXON_ID=627963 /ORGANISM="Aplanochytrium sp, Strain PBS07" /LENGTH=168 /DNA_ID=CAMNT_0026290449 /DNA_START=118 /DNA_END=624 /DNA_ORIENTATION=-
MSNPKQVFLDLSDAQRLDPQATHRLPCRIHYDGIAPVEKMFNVEETEEECFWNTSFEEHDSKNELQDGEGSLETKPEEKVSSKILKSTFRGRELNGVCLSLPPNVQGYIMNKKDNQLTANDSSQEVLQVDAVFNKIHSWKYDSLPTKNDDLYQWLSWTSIASKLHEPV